MQTNTRAVVSAGIAFLIIIVRTFFPDISEQVGNLETPLVELIVAILLLYAGLNTTTEDQRNNGNK